MNKKRFEKPQFEIIALSKLASNDGQIDGVPSNPRKFEKQKVEDLKRNIEQYPELLEYRSLMVYPIDAEQYVVIGGNMRLHVLRDELHYDDAPCVVLPKETTAEKLRAYAILDNNNFGDWDWDMLSESWDMEELSSWGLDTPKETEEPKDKSADVQLTHKIEVTLEDEAEQEQLYNELAERGYECRILTL